MRHTYRIEKYVQQANCFFAPGQKGVVHSAYRRVVNIRWGGELFSLHDSSIAMTPVSICVQDGAMEHLLAGAGELVLAGDGILRAGQTLFTIQDAEAWDSRLAAGCGIPEYRCLMEHAIDDVLTERCPEGAFGDCSMIATGCLQSASCVAGERLLLAENLVSSQDYSGAMSQIAGLLGLGGGLTPSGDDFALGVLAVLYTRRGKRLCDILWDMLRTQILSKLCDTTDLSASFLKAACGGRYSETLHRLFAARTPCEAREAAAALANTGHTSGTDVLSGMRFAFRLFKGTEKQTYLQ